MKISQKTIKKIIEFFESKPVTRVYLFGSYTRDEADRDSDIDILVELDHSKPIGLEYVKMQLDLQELLKQKVDLLSDKAISRHIKPIIDKEKILIYEK